MARSQSQKRERNVTTPEATEFFSREKSDFVSAIAAFNGQVRGQEKSSRAPQIVKNAERVGAWEAKVEMGCEDAP